MKIKVIGSGCPTCTKLYERILKLKKEGKTKADVEYSKDISELIQLGVMSSPALVIDGKVVNTGTITDEKLLSLVGGK